MADNLPEPKSRTESYLAKAAGMDVTVPEKPESRLEQYLDAIAEGGGGGGGTTYTAGDGIVIASGEISVDLAQTTGSDTKKVMSQKAVTDALAGAGGGALAIDLTTADYNANSTSWNDTDPTHFDCVAVWKLAEGMYKKTDSNVKAYLNKTKIVFGTDAVLIVGKAGNYGKPLIRFRGGSNSPDGSSYGDFRLSNDGSDGSSVYTLYKPIDDLTHQATSAPLSANQGYVLNNKFGGMKLVSISQTDYDNLGTKDPNTLYIITGA